MALSRVPLVWLTGSWLLAACASGQFAATQAPGTVLVEEVRRDAYDYTKGRKGVVLLSVNWGRRWGYCGFENVQLRSLAFDRIPVEKPGDDPRPDLVLEGPALMATPEFADYALLVEPGEYALTAYDIKTARSGRPVGGFRAGRTRLIQDGKPVAGSFDVRASEVIYIGHFATECIQERGEPVPWRYYAEGAEAFKMYLDKVKKKYPFLDLQNVEFRLFRTTTIGSEYRLP
jgi:hypothetical protein